MSATKALIKLEKHKLAFIRFGGQIMDSLFSRLETDARRKREEDCRKEGCSCCEGFLWSRIFDWFDSACSKNKRNEKKSKIVSFQSTNIEWILYSRDASQTNSLTGKALIKIKCWLSTSGHLTNKKNNSVFEKKKKEKKKEQNFLTNMNKR